MEDIETIIVEVQKILETNPHLPRLTRGEIIDLLENITKTDLEEQYKQKTTERDPKALMLVMPYTANSSSETNIQELYTKAPITHIVGGEAKPEIYLNPAATQKKKIVRRKPIHRPKPVEEVVGFKKLSESAEDRVKSSETNFKSFEPGFKPSDISFQSSETNIKSTETNIKSSETNEKSQETAFKKLPDSKVIEEFVAFKKLPDVKLPSPLKSHRFDHPKRKLERDQLPEVHTSESSPFTASTSTAKPVPQTFISKVPLRRRKPTAVPSTTQSTNFEIKDVTKKQVIRMKRPYALKTTTTKSEGTTFTTPNPITRKNTSTKKSPVYNKNSSTSNKNLETKRQQEKTKTGSNEGIHIIDPPKFKPQPPRHFLNDETIPIVNINDFLANAQTQISSETSGPVFPHLPIPDDLKNAVKDIDILMFQPSSSENPFVSSTTENVKNLLAQFQGVPFYTQSTTPVPDLTNVAETLSPEMQDLLMKFGLIPNINNPSVEVHKETPSSFQPEVIPIQPESYVQFKPLPDTAKAQDDMLEFLSQFGLAESKRSQKSLRSSDGKNKLSAEKSQVKTEELKDLKGQKRLRGENLKAEESKIVEKHIFSPVGLPGANKDDLDKLNKLMDAIRQLEKLNGTATEEDLKHIDIDGLKELVASLNQDPFKNSQNILLGNLPLDQQVAPDPMNYDFGLTKNEVKRQQSTTTTTTKPSEDDEKSANIAALEESFGGQSEAQTAASSEAPEVSTARSTGFYYLLDWNSFFDIDNQKGKRVNLRFQPHVGDPKRFYSVTVP